MTGRWTLALCVTLLGCGETAHGPPAIDGEGGAGSADGGSGGVVATVELSLDVVQHVSGGEWSPSPGAHVRIDGARSSLEVQSDEEGHVQALVVDDGPWDVTVARAGCNPISVVGVTESLSAPVHLSCHDDSEPEPEPVPEGIAIAGAIQGRNWPGSVLRLSGSRLRSSSESASSYSATLDPGEGSSPGRMLASEWDSYDRDATPLNAVWVDLPESGDAPVDIVFPTPAREVVRSQIALELPSSGAVVGADLVPEQPRIRRVEDDDSYEVGSARFEAGDDDSHYSLAIQAFADDMAPSDTHVEFNTAASEEVRRSIFFTIDPTNTESVSIPAAEVLETSGTTLDDLSVAWSAPGYAHVGASIRAWEGDGAWFVYSFAGGEPVTRAWPRLPDGVSREEVGLGSGDFRVYVFAVTQDGVPWDWEHDDRQQGVVVSSHLAPEEVRPAYDPPHTGPLNAYDGIYALGDVTMNPSSCVEEGPSVRDEYYTDYFVVVGRNRELHVAGCYDLDACRAWATASWQEEWVSASWLVSAAFPGADEGSSTFHGLRSEGELCTGWTLETGRASGVAGKELRLDVEIIEIPPFPRGDSECSTVEADAAVEGLECSQLQAFKGTFLEPI